MGGKKGGKGAAREVRDVGMGGLMWACASVSRKKNGGKKRSSERGERCGYGGAHAACEREREREGEGGGVKLIYIGKWEGRLMRHVCFCFCSALCS
jgi:hypothetical protein